MNKRNYCFVSLLLLTFFSCSENYILYCETHNSTSSKDSSSASDKIVSVDFTANVNHITTKNGTTPMQLNRKVTIYSFVHKSVFQDSTRYITTATGELSPLIGLPTQFPSGVYDLYVLGIANKNMSTPVPNLSTGYISKIENGVDYVASVIPMQSITSDIKIPLILNHICTQVIVNINSKNASIVIDSISSATITPPAVNGNFIFLFTGHISSANSLSNTPMNMNIHGNSCNQIFIPVKYVDNLTMEFSVYLNGKTTPNNYTAKIPIPNSDMSGGNSYEYSIVIGENSVTFNDININNWTNVDETGKPITPV